MIKICLNLLCGGVAGILLAASAIAGDGPEKDTDWASVLFRQVRDKYTGMSSFSSKIDCSVSVASSVNVRMLGELAISSGRWYVCLRRPEEGKNAALMLLNICDGSTLWYFDSARKCIIQSEASSGDKAAKNGAGFFPALEQYAPESLSVQSRTDSAAALKMKTKSFEKTFFGFAIFEIDLKSLLINRMTFVDSSGREQMNIAFSSIEFDKPIPESRFAFSGIDSLPVRTLKDIETKKAQKTNNK